MIRTILLLWTSSNWVRKTTSSFFSPCSVLFFWRKSKIYTVNCVTRVYQHSVMFILKFTVMLIKPHHPCLSPHIHTCSNTIPDERMWCRKLGSLVYSLGFAPSHIWWVVIILQTWFSSCWQLFTGAVEFSPIHSSGKGQLWYRNFCQEKLHGKTRVWIHQQSGLVRSLAAVECSYTSVWSSAFEFLCLHFLLNILRMQLCVYPLCKCFITKQLS